MKVLVVGSGQLIVVSEQGSLGIKGRSTLPAFVAQRLY